MGGGARGYGNLVQHSSPAGRIQGKALSVSKSFSVLADGHLTVPARIQGLKFADLPLSVRLEKLVAAKMAVQLGDLNGVPIAALFNYKNCGKTTIAELVALIEKAAAGQFQTMLGTKVSWPPVALADFLDRLILELPARDAEILERRLSGGRELLPSYESVGAQFNLSHESIRLIENKTTRLLLKAGSRRLDAYLRKIEKTCCEMVCPLTPDLFELWQGHPVRPPRYSATFYVRLLCELNPAIPAWHGRIGTCAAKHYRRGAVEVALESVLKATMRALALPEAFAQTLAKLPKLTVQEFLNVLRQSRRFRVEFHPPGQPTIKLHEVLSTDLARLILQSGDTPLTPEEILEKMAARFGRDIAQRNPRALGQALTEKQGYYLLGPRTYGLRQHFKLSKNLRTRVKNDFAQLLNQEKRPISTPELIQKHEFGWTRQTNSYELACLLRADARFADLGKFLFALTDWGIQEREYVKDLIQNILELAGQPLTSAEVLQRIQQFRSVAPNSISGHLRKHPLVRDYGSGRFGLKSWNIPAQRINSCPIAGLPEADGDKAMSGLMLQSLPVGCQ
jgi:hypothetical protein